MTKDSFAFLKDLMSQPSPSGFEAPAQKVVRARMKLFSGDVRTDVHGNVIGALNPNGAPAVMLAGHVDEIGLMLTHIDSNGFLFFAAIGGWDPAIAVGQRVIVLSEKGEIPGVIGRKPIHLMDAGDRAKEVKFDDLWIDIGASSRKDAEKAVAVGNPVVIKPDFIELRNELVASRAFDDRIGAWVVAEVLRLLKGRRIKAAVYAVSTVQEEIGLRGAVTSTFNVNPQVGIAVDVGFTSDFPAGEPKKVGDIKIGKGPILHAGPNINPALGRMLCQAAKRARIPFQMQAEPRATGTDANAMQLARGGCAAALVSVPNRYMHSPVELISLSDAEQTARLIAETVAALSPKDHFIPA